MGLASSQARLLDLTARLHQIEYKSQRLEAQKLQMANESTKVYEDYLEALDKTKIQYKILTTDGSITYTDINSYQDFLNAGYAINYKGVTYTNSSEKTTGTGYVGNEDGIVYATADEATAAGNSGYTTQEANSWYDLLQALGITTVSGNFETLITNIINSGEVTIVSATSDGAFKDGNAVDFAEYETSVSTNTGLQEVSDEVALKKAEAKYEADMKKIDNKDRKYDTDLAAVETEREAIVEEIDTLKTVAKDDVDRTYKLFS